MPRFSRRDFLKIGSILSGAVAASRLAPQASLPGQESRKYVNLLTCSVDVLAGPGGPKDAQRSLFVVEAKANRAELLAKVNTVNAKCGA